MRILLCVEHFFGDVRGGAYRIAQDCAAHLARHGHDVTLVCESTDGTTSVAEISGITVLRYGLPKRGWNVANTRRRLVASAVKKRYAADHPELIWGHSPFQFLGATDAFPRCVATYTVHSPVSEEMRESGKYESALGSWKIRAGRMFERQCLERAQRVLVLSEFTQRLLNAIHGMRFARKIAVSPGWVDTQRYLPREDRLQLRKKLGWRTDVPVFFSLRRLVPRMGIDRLIRAASILRNKGMAIALYIGGEGEMGTALARQIEDESLGDRVLMLGPIQEEQLTDCYAACNAFVIPTRALECFGLIAIEAMAAGTVVLSTPVGALPEIIAPIAPDWLAHGNSAEEIADLLGRFLGGALAMPAASETRRYVREHYDAQVACERFCALALAS